MTTKELYDNPEKYAQMTEAASNRILSFIFEDEETMKMTADEIKRSLDLAKVTISNIVEFTLDKTSFEDIVETFVSIPKGACQYQPDDQESH